MTSRSESDCDFPPYYIAITKVSAFQLNLSIPLQYSKVENPVNKSAQKVWANPCRNTPYCTEQMFTLWGADLCDPPLSA